MRRARARTVRRQDRESTGAEVSLTSWSLLGAFKVPKYYAEKTGGSVSGFKLWGDFGFSNPVVNLGRTEIRFGGTLFAHFSFIQVETALRKYDLHDISVGLALEFGWLYRFRKNAIEFAKAIYKAVRRA